MNITLDNNTTFVVVLVLLIIYSLQKAYFNSKKADRDLKLLQLQLNVNIDREPILKTLDDFIEDVFNDYISQHTKYTTMVYISDDAQTDMTNHIIELISERMSPYLYQRLALIYNEKAIPNILANRVVMMITVFAADRNTIRPKQDSKIDLDL